jgi:radical SAM protein with 4Fe4S-binding SPASM domain
VTELTYMPKLLVEAGKKTIPLEVALELTHHCNFRCQHCYIPDFSAPDLLSTERIFAILDELAEMGTLYLTLTGGEMMLRKDWFVIAERARELGFSLRLFTNGSTIDEENADRIATLHATVEVSLYSMDREIFERITDRPGSFDKTLRGIELLRERGIDVLLKIPMMVHNTSGFEKVFEYAEAIGATARADARIVAKKNGDLVTLQLRAAPDALLPLYRSGYTPCSVPQEYENDPRSEGPLCAAGNRYANIASSGEVRACNILPGAAGNLREQSFREIWEGSAWLQKIRAIRRRDLDTCNTCSKFSYCGRCHAMALVEDGNVMGPSRSACSHAETLERVHAERAEPTERQEAHA